jgi:ketosteroid isomerase-like protein
MAIVNDDTGETLVALEHELARAWVAGDCAAWAALVAPEWTVTHLDGQVITRDQAIAMCRAAPVRAAAMRYEDLAVRVFGTTAVATGRTIAIAESEPPETVVLRFTDVWIHRDARWQVVASHATRVVQP